MTFTNTDSLLRHRTIDACLRDHKRKYSLKDLIFACRDAFDLQYKNSKTKEKRKKAPVSARTVQLDLQFMRDKKKGYGAPIIVYENKYYKYSDSKYSIDKVNVKKNNLNKIEEIISNLKELSKFSEFQSTRAAIKILDEEIGAIYQNRNPVVSYEGNVRSLGIEYFDNIHDAIINKKVLCIGYYSSRSENIIPIIFYPFYLKEYAGRWFAFGYKDGLDGVYKLPLDRIRDLSYSILPFPDNLFFNQESYFKDIIGVTKLSGKIREIELLVRNRLAPYIKLNQLHSSQVVSRVEDNGDIVFTINIIPNKEFYALIYKYRPDIEVASPRDIGLESNRYILFVMENLPQYPLEKKQEDIITENSFDDLEFNLFSELN